MTMALPLDNPSYFSVSEGALAQTRGKFRLFRKKMGSSTSQGSAASMKVPPMVTANTSRRQFRTLLRSVSSNSADSNQELLVLGEPRPSDIAPPSPYMSARRQTDPTRRPKKPSELMDGDLIYCPLATSEDAADAIDVAAGDASEPEEEVFFTEDSARYYNLTAAPKETGRRHSVGTYLVAERERALSVASSSKSYKEDFRVVVHATADGEPVLDGQSSFQKRNNRHKARGTKMPTANMNDIAIISSVSSQTATLWVDYLTKSFMDVDHDPSRPGYKVLHISIEEVIESGGIKPILREKLEGIKLHVVIACPQLLEHVDSNPTACASLGKLLQPDRTMAMLLGVTDDHLTDTHYSALPSFRQWQLHCVDKDEDQCFVRNFIASAINIITTVTKQQQVMETQARFSLVTKKVNPSQKQVIIILDEALESGENVKVSVEQKGESIDIHYKKKNPFILKFVMPDVFLEVSSFVFVLVEKNGNLLGKMKVKCESHLRVLDGILRSQYNPLEFMCQSFGLNKEQLDNWMLQSFQKNLPPNFNLFSNNAEPVNPQKVRPLQSHEEYPTLLHFAAKFNLEKLAWQLLECPGGDLACEMYNANGLTPAQLANNGGYEKLATHLRGYMEMMELTKMYSYLEAMSINKSETTATGVANNNNDKEMVGEYEVPKSHDSQYSIPPPARPVQPYNSEPYTGYLEMQRSGSQTSRSNSMSNLARIPRDESDSSRTGSSLNIHKFEENVQGEIDELMNDFRDNVFTLNDIQTMVQWRNKIDIPKSDKEKQEQIDAIREKYERFQQQLTTDSKKRTLFDRMKNLFQRSKASNMKELQDNLANGKVRPVSSVSVQSTASSSSSGRMSTISASSAISMTDSGTHSDQEDRKLLMQPITDHEYYTIKEDTQSVASNYSFPPAPKPIHRQNSYKSTFSSFSPIIERPPHPVPRVDDKKPEDFYIRFPPSGLPVKSQLNMKFQSPSPTPVHETQAEYILPDENANHDPKEYACIESEELPEYINCVLPRN